MKDFNRKDLLFRIVFSLSAGIAVLLFFALSIPYHMRFQEQYQMFLFTSDYFRDVVCMPGGLAVYVGRFLTQFFISSFAGALIIALLFSAVQLLAFSVLRKEEGCIFHYVAAFVPAGLMALFFTDANALLSTFVAALAGLSCALIPLEGKGRILRCTLTFLLAAVLYFTCGSLGVAFFAAAAAYRQKDWIPAFLAIASVFCGALSVRGTCDFPFSRLLAGIHYSRYHDNVPLFPWISAFSFACIAVLSAFVRKMPGRTGSTVIFVLVFASLMLGLSFRKNGSMEELCKYSTLTRDEKWNDIIQAASKEHPSTPLAMSCLNLALAKADAIGEWMFRYGQINPDGLFYPYRREHMSPVPASMVYWHLGFLNTSQRFTFAAEEVIPDYQKSAWNHKRLAEIYLTSGFIDLARKRLEPLKYTLFYRKWALETERLLNDPSLIDSHPVYGQIRKLSLKEHNHTYVIDDLYRPLEMLVQENPDNRTAVQYLLGNCLIRRDLDRFVEYIKYDMDHIGDRAYQEAYILFWSRDHDGPQGMPSFVSSKTIDRFNRFNMDLMSRDEDYIWNHYSDTYWLYFINEEDQQ